MTRPIDSVSALFFTGESGTAVNKLIDNKIDVLKKKKLKEGENLSKFDKLELQEDKNPAVKETTTNSEAAETSSVQTSAPQENEESFSDFKTRKSKENAEAVVKKHEALARATISKEKGEDYRPKKQEVYDQVAKDLMGVLELIKKMSAQSGWPMYQVREKVPVLPPNSSLSDYEAQQIDVNPVSIAHDLNAIKSFCSPDLAREIETLIAEFGFSNPTPAVNISDISDII